MLGRFRRSPRQITVPTVTVTAPVRTDTTEHERRRSPNPSRRYAKRTLGRGLDALESRILLSTVASSSSFAETHNTTERVAEIATVTHNHAVTAVTAHNAADAKVTILPVATRTPTRPYVETGPRGPAGQFRTLPTTAADAASSHGKSSDASAAARRDRPSLIPDATKPRGFVVVFRGPIAREWSRFIPRSFRQAAYDDIQALAKS